MRIDLFTDTVAILNSIVSNSYYGMLRGQISMYLPPEHPIIDIWNNVIQNGRRIGKKVYLFLAACKVAWGRLGKSISLNSGFACEIASLNFDLFDQNRKETRHKSVNIGEKYDSNTKTTLERKKEM